MADFLVIRLHPINPLDSGTDFTAYLSGLIIYAYEKSFTVLDPSAPLGQAAYLPLSINNRIVQHEDPSGNKQPAATAIIDITSSAPEFRTGDIILRVERSGNPIVPRSTHYNVEVYTGSQPTENQYQTLPVTSVYQALPGLGVILDPSVPDVNIPTDGSAPNYYELLNAVNAVLAQDPTGSVDIASLDLDQCLHIANEIVWNRQAEPLPEPPQSLEKMYTTNSNDLLLNADRIRFEAEVQGYYAERNAEAEQLSRYIYSLVAAMQAETMSAAASRASLRYPIRLDATDPEGRIKEADVTLT